MMNAESFIIGGTNNLSPKTRPIYAVHQTGCHIYNRGVSARFYGTDAEILEFIVAPDTKITKVPLKDMGFPKNAIVGGIIRGNESFIAVGDTQIQAYDRVAVFALPEAVKDVDKFFR